jgi:predicted 2-oxoglutarate/Fe(II)-dependent dioxygenase YbiX
MERFLPGDPVRGFVCAAPNTDRFAFDTVAGRYIVLCFFGSAASETGAAVLALVNGDLEAVFDDTKVSFFGVSIDPADRSQGRVRERIPGIRYFWDFERTVSGLYGAAVAPATGDPTTGDPAAGDPSGGSTIPYQPFTLVLDPALRVLASLGMHDLDAHNRTLRHILAALPAIDSHAGVPLTAPVLVVPRVFEPGLCKHLIALYEAHGGQESGFMRQVEDKTIGVVDFSVKRRKDYEIQDENVRAAMRARINRRLVPEILKSFQFRTTHIERYIVACYEAENRGFFRPHRDNTTKGTAHRRFACTINLNAEDYEGGELRFPEFGSRLYRAPTGGAVVFSCSLLHEATPVTRGRRYATLPFLYDGEAAKIRVENRKFLSREVIDLNAGDAPSRGEQEDAGAATG